MGAAQERLLNDEDYQAGSRSRRLPRRLEARRDQNRTLLGAHGVRVLEACILDDTCKKRLARALRARRRTPLRAAFQTEAEGHRRTRPSAERGRGGERAPRLRDGGRGDPRARVEPRGRGRLEAETCCDRARLLRADAPRGWRNGGNKTDADALNDFRRDVRADCARPKSLGSSPARGHGCREEGHCFVEAVDASVAAQPAGAALPGGLLSRPAARKSLRTSCRCPWSWRRSTSARSRTAGRLRHSDRWVNVAVRLLERRRRRPLPRDGRHRELAPIRCCCRGLLAVYDNLAQTGRDVQLAPLPDDSDPAFRSVPG